MFSLNEDMSRPPNISHAYLVSLVTIPLFKTFSSCSEVFPTCICKKCQRSLLRLPQTRIEELEVNLATVNFPVALTTSLWTEDFMQVFFSNWCYEPDLILVDCVTGVGAYTDWVWCG